MNHQKLLMQIINLSFSLGKSWHNLPPPPKKKREEEKALEFAMCGERGLPS
jgi:hypothetical protein